MADFGLARSPSYLLIKRHRLFFRIMVPESLRPRLDRCEIRRSLGIVGLVEAREKAQRLGLMAKDIFRQLERNRGVMSGLSDERIRELVDQWLREAIQEDEEWRITTVYHDPSEQQEHSEFRALFASATKSDLARGEYGVTRPFAKALIDGAGLEVDESSISFKKLCRELMKGLGYLSQIQEKRDRGDYSEEFKPPQTLTAETPTASEKEVQEPNEKVSTLVAKYVKEKVEYEGWSKASVSANQLDLERFVKLIDDPPANTLTREIVETYRDLFAKLPARMSQLKRYRDKSLKQVLRMKIPDEDRLDDRTKTNAYQRVRSFLNWAEERGYTSSPFLVSPLKVGRKLTKKATKKKLVDPFTGDDLSKLFSAPGYVDDTFTRSYMFWLPLIGLYTGARIEELCQLHLSDIYQKEGVWVFDINDQLEKELKNNTSPRLVPVHPVLIEVGLLERVGRLSAGGHQRFFSELKKSDATGYAKTPGAWFSKFKDEVGVAEQEGFKKKTFHNFRRTMADYLEKNRFDEKQSKAVLGHKFKDEINQAYTTPYGPRRLFDDVITKIEFGVEERIRRLKGSKWTTAG